MDLVVLKFDRGRHDQTVGNNALYASREVACRRSQDHYAVNFSDHAIDHDLLRHIRLFDEVLVLFQEVQVRRSNDCESATLRSLCVIQIFLTCKEELIGALGGNVIRL